MDIDNILACPNCGERIVSDSLHCQSCRAQGSYRNGIFSFIAPCMSGSTWLTKKELEAFADAAEATSIENALSTTLENHEYKHQLLSELNEVSRDNWRVIASNCINGRCLDLHAGYGRRSLSLATLADKVYAVDSNIAKLRILTTRVNRDRIKKVVPVHAEADRLPFVGHSFDTVVMDLTGANGQKVEQQVKQISRYLKKDGTLIMIVDGLTRKLGLPQRLSYEKRPPDDRGDFLPNLYSYRSILESIGFESIDVLALLPTSQNLKYVFNINHDDAVQAFSQQIKSTVSNNSRIDRGISAMITATTRTKALRYTYPNYCIIGRSDDRPNVSSKTIDFDSPLVISGRMRSIVLDFESEELSTVYKIANRPAHVPVVEREVRVPEELRSINNPIIKTIPNTNLMSSKFGKVGYENPVNGQPLADRYFVEIDSFRRVVELGFEWLTEFQQAFEGERVVRSPEEVASDLSFPPLNLYPPGIQTSVEFCLTPVHGDYTPENIYVRGGQVTKIIDWEYSTFASCPIVDASRFVLSVAKDVFGSVDAAYRKILYEDNEYSKILEFYIEDYCHELNIDTQVFYLYFPSVYLHRLELEWKQDMIKTYPSKFDKRVSRINMMWNVQNSLSQM